MIRTKVMMMMMIAVMMVTAGVCVCEDVRSLSSPEASVCLLFLTRNVSVVCSITHLDDRRALSCMKGDPLSLRSLQQ